jgi:hypothetical protein
LPLPNDAYALIERYPGREVADGAGYLDAADGGVVHRAVAGSRAVPVSGLRGQAAVICQLSDIAAARLDPGSINRWVGILAQLVPPIPDWPP